MTGKCLVQDKIFYLVVTPVLTPQTSWGAREVKSRLSLLCAINGDAQFYNSQFSSYVGQEMISLLDLKEDLEKSASSEQPRSTAAVVNCVYLASPI